EEHSNYSEQRSLSGSCSQNNSLAFIILPVQWGFTYLGPRNFGLEGGRGTWTQYSDPFTRAPVSSKWTARQGADR
ncbi:MAG: hypothetical protein ACRD0E_02135, partial [Acidimicrobiales bacterium]